MKRVIKSRIFLVIITMIICISGALYAANNYKASDVLYTSSDGTSMTVDDALNDLYDKKSCSNINLDIEKHFTMDTNFNYKVGIPNINTDHIIVELLNFSIPSSLTSTISFSKSADENGNITISRTGDSGKISVVGIIYVNDNLEFLTNATGGYSTTIDCTSIENYKDLSIIDFFIDFRYLKFTGNSGSVTISKSYNASTGKLTISRGSLGGTVTAYFNIDVYFKK